MRTDVKCLRQSIRKCKLAKREHQYDAELDGIGDINSLERKKGRLKTH